MSHCDPECERTDRMAPGALPSSDRRTSRAASTRTASTRAALWVVAGCVFALALGCSSPGSDDDEAGSDVAEDGPREVDDTAGADATDGGSPGTDAPDEDGADTDPSDGDGAETAPTDASEVDPDSASDGDPSVDAPDGEDLASPDGEIGDLGSDAVPTADGAVIPGACVDDEQPMDITHWNLAVRECAPACADADRPVRCMTDCVQDRVEYTEGCAWCLAGVGVCVADSCSTECEQELSGDLDTIEEPLGESCFACADDRCGPEFVLCAGIDDDLPDPPDPQCVDSGWEEEDEPRELAGAMRTCWADCRLTETPTTCFSRCVWDSTSLNSLCVGCASTYASCASVLCRLRCARDIFSYGCAECDVCSEPLGACLGTDVAEIFDQDGPAQIRVAQAAMASEPVAFLLMPEGIPIHRWVPAPGIFGPMEIPSGELRVALSDGSSGPSATILTEETVDLLPGEFVTAIAYDGAEGLDLVTLVEPETGHLGTRWRVFHAASSRPDLRMGSMSSPDEDWVTPRYGRVTPWVQEFGRSIRLGADFDGDLARDADAFVELTDGQWITIVTFDDPTRVEGVSALVFFANSTVGIIAFGPL